MKETFTIEINEAQRLLIVQALDSLKVAGIDVNGEVSELLGLFEELPEVQAQFAAEGNEDLIHGLCW